MLFRIFGEPVQEPKKDIGRYLGKDKKAIMTLVPKDYRVAKDQNGVDFKWDVGFAQRWKNHVCACITYLMQCNGLDPYPSGIPIALGVIVYRTAPKFPDGWIPYSKPDLDNYCYAIHNCLKSTKTPKGDGPYPDGVLYYDDNQICWTTPWEGKVYADDTEPPGVLISVADCNEIKEDIEKLAYPGRLRLL